MSNIDIIYIRTADKLELQGVHYIPKEKDVCVLMTHGTNENFVENKWANVVGRKLSKNGIGFVYGHNRGYSHINDIATDELEEDGGYERERIGTTYERFADCVYDVEGWLNKVRELNYKKIFLLGYSLGCNKNIYYLHRHKQKDIAGIILISPPDMVGLAKIPEYQPNYQDLLEEAKKNMKLGEPRKLLSTLVWDWKILSSQTFLDLFEEGGPADNLPVLKNPERFVELSSINVPILTTMGEYDNIAIKTLQEDMELIESKAISCPSFTKRFIMGSNHFYERQEESLADSILDWVKEQLKMKPEDFSR